MKMYKLGLVLLLSFLIPSLFNIVRADGIQIGRTRIVYDARKKETALPLVNQDKELPWLIQSWVTLEDKKTAAPFIVTPPLFRLDPQKEQSLRIIWSGTSVPSDKESLFYLIVRTIPGSDKKNENQNVLRIIYKTQLKLFYRPEGLQGTPDQACQNLHFARSGSQLQIKNESGYHLVFDSLYLGHSQQRKADIVAPKSTATLAVSDSSRQVSWRCITDYGNASPKYTAVVEQGSGTQ